MKNLTKNSDRLTVRLEHRLWTDMFSRMAPLFKEEIEEHNLYGVAQTLEENVMRGQGNLSANAALEAANRQRFVRTLTLKDDVTCAALYTQFQQCAEDVQDKLALQAA